MPHIKKYNDYWHLANASYRKYKFYGLLVENIHIKYYL